MLTVFPFIVIILLLFVCQRNPILHSKAKHIEIKHHFISDYIQKGILDIQFIETEHQWDDIFIKPLTVERFDFIKKNLNMHCVSY